MDFHFSDEQQALINAADEFARDEIAPHAAEWDKKEFFPVDVFRKAAALGFAGMLVREDVGGSHLSRTDAAAIFQTLATACVSTAAYLSIHNMISWLIDQFGTPEQRQHYLPRLCTMELLSSYCLTEPQSGSDAASLQTTAKRDGDHYIVNGSKCFISGAGATDLYLVMVRTGGEGSDGISCLLIDKDTPGLSFGKKEEKLGWRNQPTRMVFFNDCKVPVSNRIADEGQGFKLALRALNGGRVNIAACSLGGALACLRATKTYLHERQQFKQPLKDFQTIQFKFADLLTEYDAARLMVFRAATSLDQQHPDVITHCAMAKRFATDTGFSISDACLQLFGGYGYLQDYPIERFFRDLRVHSILEGSNEIMKVLIARYVLSEQYTLI